MASGVQSRLTEHEGRRFGLTLGIGFLFLAVLFWVRSSPVVATGFLGLGAIALSIGLVCPTRLTPVRRVWMTVTHAIGGVTTPVLLGLVYFLVITPTGLMLRLLRRSPLHHVDVAGSYWTAKPEAERRMRSMERQF